MTPVKEIEKGVVITAAWLNTLVRAINAARNLTINYGQVLAAEANTKIILPLFDLLSGVSTASQQHAFQAYRSRFLGTGAAPADQPFRLRIRVGSVKNTFPENISQEFVCAPSSVIVFWVAGSFDSAGTLLSTIIDSGSAVPADPNGSVDNAPPVSRRPLFVVYTDAHGITGFGQIVRSALDVTPLVRAVTCEGNILAYFWGETLSTYIISTEGGGD